MMREIHASCVKDGILIFRPSISEWEMREWVKSYTSITEDNFRNGIIDGDFYREIMQEIYDMAYCNSQLLAINRLHAANLI